jgi:hypothetical protein
VSNGEGGYPSVPRQRLEIRGWELHSRTEETVFRIPAAAVIGHALVYRGATLQAAMAAAGVGDLLAGSGDGDGYLIDVDDGLWRFFFATALSFQPSLPPVVGAASIRPIVAREARRSFIRDLEARGFERVESGAGQRLRTESGERARLRKITATRPLDAASTPERIDIEGWIAAWDANGSFRIAGGAHPVDGIDALVASLPDAERPSTDPSQFRDELLELIGAVR